MSLSARPVVDNAIAEIGLAVCANCGHGRSEHGYCDERFPAICTHPEALEDSGGYGVCLCMQFVTEEELANGRF